jgi:hypothetical protein
MKPLGDKPPPASGREEEEEEEDTPGDLLQKILEVRYLAQAHAQPRTNLKLL